MQIRKVKELVANGYYHARPRLAVPERPELSYGIKMSNDFPIIAEVKISSPSSGMISTMGARQLIDDYITGGAAALSIITEPISFEGSLGILECVRDPDVPVLMKDFIVSVQQVEAAKHFGASAILLIQGIFDIDGGNMMRDELIAKAHEIGLEVVIEGHDQFELQRAMESDADILAINQRNLHTLEVFPGHALRLLPYIGRDERPIIVMSGIRSQRDIIDIRDAWGDAVLIGTDLVSSGSPKARLLQLAVSR